MVLFQEGRVLKLEHSRQFSIGALRSGLPGVARTEVLFPACRCWVAYSQAYYSVRSAGAPWEAVPVSASLSCWEPLLIELIGCFLAGRGGWPLAIDLPKLWPSYRHRPPVLLPPLELGLFLLDELVHKLVPIAEIRVCLLRARRRPVRGIASSSFLDFTTQAPSANILLFPQRGTSSSGKWLTGDVKMSRGQLGGWIVSPKEKHPSQSQVLVPPGQVSGKESR